MTAQNMDTIRYNQEIYQISLGESRIFDAQQFGLLPTSYTSANWRGYVCEFQIRDDELVLDNLTINHDDGSWHIQAPVLNGLAPVEAEQLTESLLCRYENVNLRIGYTGHLFVGREFLSEFLVNKGYQKPHAFGVLLELSFDAGKLVSVLNRSREATTLRGMIDVTTRSIFESGVTKEMIVKAFDVGPGGSWYCQ